ncbi:putative lipoprotein [Pectobacterium atrosepticum SCRI1043]|uniref:Lipoprotein n=1 Tax=Pectobacterium atrosepticum (strain SCRI 1043 / ATCC BAA-672) TaxID=218491 RepID=Q6D4M6_PECAS|nr:hypothetical protein [Pectobacterium atrosepticum]MCL6315642.1 hypothetical protein [Pectobacterium atrosepticum]MCL6320122.1 hypothetical protein [Pectobacterium atrosepticum]CAG75267.1 putative lipoprotein [Pectobacterium atrosepticum SCRI1043]
MKYLFAIIPLMLTSCTTASELQSECEKRYVRLSDMATCLDYSIKEEPILSSTPWLKLYVLNAKLLGQKVDKGELKDLEARIELQNQYIAYKQQEAEADEARYQQSQKNQLVQQEIDRNQQSIDRAKIINDKIAAQ